MAYLGRPSTGDSPFAIGDKAMRDTSSPQPPSQRNPTPRQNMAPPGPPPSFGSMQAPSPFGSASDEARRRYEERYAKKRAEEAAKAEEEARKANPPQGQGQGQYAQGGQGGYPGGYPQQQQQQQQPPYGSYNNGPPPPAAGPQRYSSPPVNQHQRPFSPSGSGSYSQHQQPLQPSHPGHQNPSPPNSGGGGGYNPPYPQGQPPPQHRPASIQQPPRGYTSPPPQHQAPPPLQQRYSNPPPPHSSSGGHGGPQWSANTAPPPSQQWSKPQSPPPPPVQQEDPQLRHLFNQFDSSRSGQLNSFDLQRLLAKDETIEAREDCVKMLMNIFDTDRSGSINFMEFEGLYRYIQDWHGIFLRFDKDHSGLIDRKELHQALLGFGFSLPADMVKKLEKRFSPPPAPGGPPSRGISFDRFLMACVTVKHFTESFRRADVRNEGRLTLDYNQFMDMMLDSPS